MAFPKREAATLAGAVLAVLLAAEAIVRRTEFARYQWDANAGLLHRPGMVCRYAREGFGRSHWLEKGVRQSGAQPHSAEKRVLVLGDSFTEALQVNDDEAFTSIAQEQLGRQGPRCEIVNAGMAGLSPSDYVFFAKHNIQAFQPQWTIVQLSDQDFEGESWDKSKPHFVRTPNGHLAVMSAEEDPSLRVAVRRELYEDLAERIALVRFIRIRLRDFAAGLSNEPPLFHAGSVANGTPKRAAPAPGDSDALEEEVNLLRDSYRGHLSLLYLVTLDWADPLKKTLTEERLGVVAERAGIRMCSTRDYMQESVRAGHAAYGFANSGFNSGHMNRLGHRITAEAMVREIQFLVTRGLF